MITKKTMRSTAKSCICSETIFDVAQRQEKVRRLEAEVSQDSFWDQNPNAQTILSDLSREKRQLEGYANLVTQKEDIAVYFDLIEEEGESESLLSDLTPLMESFKAEIDSLETRSLLSGKYDASHCYLSLNAGAGGVDAQDWTQMLLRMVQRWCEKEEFSVDVLDQSMGEEAGIKSVTLHIKGDYAYGLLKNEIGIHRLVRLSPFNANNKRQTSFAAVDVLPEIEADLNLDIDPKDLKIDTYRASGAGGQHVNKTDSAVRITHIPTGTVAQCQNERSQAANKETAMTMLKSRLVVLLEEQHKEKLDEIRGDVKDIAWGNQIRSYVFHPYKLVKDLRTQHETSDVPGVMDGDLTPFIEAHLRHLAKKERDI